MNESNEQSIFCCLFIFVKKKRVDLLEINMMNELINTEWSILMDV